jgi:hypothetical protein
MVINWVRARPAARGADQNFMRRSIVVFRGNQRIISIYALITGACRVGYAAVQHHVYRSIRLTQIREVFAGCLRSVNAGA